MNTIQRAGLGMLVALAIALTASVASAIEYADVIGLARQGVSDRTIVELIVKDGRAFEMTDEETQALVDAGVSQVVINAMLDPAAGQDWLDGKSAGPAYDEDGIPTNNDYSTALDQAYQSGYSAGTALVYSFGYYYGPLSRYYYDDPFYFSFYWGGYGGGYWPSYYASYYRPYWGWCSPYPYNYYNYNSYYCYTYYDPGYYHANGYPVQPGYGRTVWDNGPRWRDGGLPPDGGHTTFDGRSDGVRSRLLAGEFVDAGHGGAGRPAAPPVVQPATGARAGTRGGDLVGQRPSTQPRTQPAVDAGARSNGRSNLVSGTRAGSGNGRIYRVGSPASGRTVSGSVTRTTDPPRRTAYAGLGEHLRGSSSYPTPERGRVNAGGRTYRVDPGSGILRSLGNGSANRGRSMGRSSEAPSGSAPATQNRGNGSAGGGGSHAVRGGGSSAPPAHGGDAPSGGGGSHGGGGGSHGGGAPSGGGHPASGSGGSRGR